VYAGAWSYSGGGVGTDRFPTSPDFAASTSQYSESQISFTTDPTDSLTQAQMTRAAGSGSTEKLKGDSVHSTFGIAVGVSAKDTGEDESRAKGWVTFDERTFTVDEVTY
jgi:hypothetical protein